MNNLIDELDDGYDVFTLQAQEEKEDKKEKTREIEILDIDFGREKDKTNEFYDKKVEKKRLPINIYEDHVLQRTFVSCSILGFVTLFMSYGSIIYILMHI